MYIFLLFIILIIVTLLYHKMLYPPFMIYNCDSPKKYSEYKHMITKDIPLDESVELPDIEWEKYIPKKIYRTYSTSEKISPYKPVFEKTKQILPDYETEIYYDDDIEKYIKTYYSDRILKAYKSINPEYGPARADFFRYLVIYREGGIYLDIKSGPVKNLDPILEGLSGKMAISHWTKKPIGLYPINSACSMFVESIFGEYQNWYVVSGKGNPVLRKVIKQVVTNIEYGLKNKNTYIHGKASVLCMTGPLMLTRVIEKYYDKKYLSEFRSHLDRYLGYDIVVHTDIEKNHYTKNKNSNILVS